VAGLVGVLDSRVGATVLTCFARADTALPGGVRLESERGCVGSVELCSLLAPRPLLLQAPEADPTIALPEAQSAARHVRRAYALAEAPERCELRTFDGVLELDYDSAAAWFRRWL
jgi:hypothetical protein